MRGLSEEVERALFVTKIKMLAYSPSPRKRMANRASVTTFSTLPRIDAEFVQGIMRFDPSVIYSFFSIEWPVHPAQDSEHRNEDTSEASKDESPGGYSSMSFFC